MENFERLEIKVDSLTDLNRSVLESLQKVLTEMQQQNKDKDLVFFRIGALEKSNERDSEVRKKIYERLEKIENRCAVRETALPIRHCEDYNKQASFGEQAQTWVSSKVGQWVISVGISGAVMATIIEFVRAFLKR
ncbi:hypothetical protein FACS1894204_05720 [Synergistales bacterium]|nr:hypothetical protein FACS1894204_05720 [Synergistales bacterium]